CNGEWGSQGGKIQIRKALGRTYIAFAVEEATKVKRTRKALLGITMRRMKLEVSFNGGKVINYISNAAHFVIMSFPGFHVEFDTIVKRCFFNLSYGSGVDVKLLDALGTEVHWKP
ncbi:hypothetical protein Tco_1441042, partial [Tanacetum coccineum]